MSTSIDAPAHQLFGLLSDYKQAEEVIEGLEGLFPIGKQTAGVGASFHAVMRLGPKTVRADIEIAELVEDRLVCWRSSNGDDRSITFELRQLESATAVRLTVAYEQSQSLSAALLSPVVEEAVRQRSRATLERMRVLSESERA